MHSNIFIKPIISIVLCASMMLRCIETEQISIMTFNTWVAGTNVKDGLHKIAKHIKFIDPDVVALQEVTSIDSLNKIMEYLGGGWNKAVRNASYSDVAILTKHLIVPNTTFEAKRGIGVTIKHIDANFSVNVWNMHLDYKSYGPYAAFNKLVIYPDQILAGEMNYGAGRFANIRDLLVNEHFQEALADSDEIPLFVCGDFNSPSHLDWTKDTRNIHGGWAYQWPATKILQSEAAMTDSFREIFPNVRKYPGLTWSTVQKQAVGWESTIPEPQDRIDYIFYKGKQVKTTWSSTYQGKDMVRSKPNHYYNDYPSDHYALISMFSINSQ